MPMCWLHLHGIGMINSPIGMPEDPVGVCKDCSSLTCGWHGVRTSKAKSAKFVCALCDETALVSSGA